MKCQDADLPPFIAIVFCVYFECIRQNLKCNTNMNITKIISSPTESGREMGKLQVVINLSKSLFLLWPKNYLQQPGNLPVFNSLTRAHQPQP